MVWVNLGCFCRLFWNDGMENLDDYCWVDLSGEIMCDVYID